MRQLGRTIVCIDAGKGLQILRDGLGRSNATFGPEHAETLRYLDSLATAYEIAKKPDEAEPVLRQCLAIREKKSPGLWATFNTKSLLGRSLLEQEKYAEAEPLLLAGYEGMRKAADVDDDADKQERLIEELKRLVQLYDAMNKKDKADMWRKKLPEAQNSNNKPTMP